MSFTRGRTQDFIEQIDSTVPLRRFTHPRILGYLLIAGAFIAVWVGAKHHTVFILTVLAVLPAQYFVCRAILVERRYNPVFAWFSLLLGPMGILVVLGFPVLPDASERSVR